MFICRLFTQFSDFFEDGRHVLPYDNNCGHPRGLRLCDFEEKGVALRYPQLERARQQQ
jgi:hypothetical protein